MPNPMFNRVREGGEGYSSQPLATLECVIERITFHNPENGYCVLKVVPAEAKGRAKGDLIPVLGSFSNPVVGESVRLHGTWIKHPQYGSQFKSERYETLRPATAAAMEKYLGSGMVKGIGPVMAKRIVAKFGDKALDVIEETPEKLTQVPGIGEKRIDLIKAAWDEQREIRAIMLFLQGHGVTPTYAVKIYKRYKERAIEVVEKNPYQLASDIWGIGFKSADKIAQAIGIAPDAPERLEAGLVYVLNQEMEGGGHCFLLEEDLVKKACEILLPEAAPEGDDEAKRELVARADAIRASLKSLVSRELLIAEPFDFLGQEQVAVYTPSIYQTEKGLAERINTLLNSPWRSRPKPAEIDALLADLPGAEMLSEEQTNAVRRALCEPLLVLTGGPGCGKTFTTKVIVAAFEKLGKRLQIASPTGRAAKRAAGGTGREGKTIHRLLAFDPEKNDFKHGPGEPLELDVLIVDESSMLDLVLTHKTLRAVPDGAQVIFVGDVDQLPSVGPGNVLADLIKSGRVPVAKLTQVFRQAAESHIITNAHAINRGKMPNLLPPSAVKEGADCVFLEVDEPEEVIQKIMGVVAKSLPRLGHRPEDITVLAPMQRGSLGARNLNEVLQEVLNPPAPNKAEHIRGPITFRVGDRVMQRRNNYDKNVFNGDVGHIRAIDKENQTVAIEYPEQTVEYDFADMDELMHAFSLTTHKCVAEYERVWTADRGLVPIRDLTVGDRVVTGQGEVREVRDVVATGTRPVVRLRTGAGFTIDVSPEHPILVATASPTPTWKRADEVAPGDVVCMERSVIDPPGEVPLPAIRPLAGRRCPPPAVPEVLDERLSYLLGALVGDGSYRDRKDGTVDFTSQDAELLRAVWDTLNSYGLRVCRYQKAGTAAERLYVVSRAFRQWLLELGLDFCRAEAKCIPPVLFSASARCKAAFLRGLFDTDGRAGRGSVRAVRLVTASERLGREVQELLLSLGIVSRRSKSGPNAWCLSVSGTSLPSYAERVGFSVAYKHRRLHDMLARAGARASKTNDDTIPFGSVLANQILAASAAHQGASQGRRGCGFNALGSTVGSQVLYPIRSGMRRMSHRHLGDLIARLHQQGVPVPKDAAETVARHYYYDAVVEVGRTGETVPMYDIEVEGIHSFVAGPGFVCHNSQGSEYPACVIVVHTQHYMMLQRNLVYTALTRAKKMGVFIGSKRAIGMGGGKTRGVPRNTRLAERLQNLIEGLGKNGKSAAKSSRNGAPLPTPPLPGRLF